MRKPNPIEHMTGYGAVFGFIFAMLYMWGILIIPSPPIIGFLEVLIQTGLIALLLGTIPGLIIGFIEGWILGIMTRGITHTSKKRGLRLHKDRAIVIIGSLTAVAMGIVYVPTYVLLINLSHEATLLDSSVLLLPILIASFASMYAVQLYYVKLEAWGGIEKRKNKAKHKPKHQLDDSAAGEQFDISEPNSEVKQMKTDE